MHLPINPKVNQVFRVNLAIGNRGLTECRYGACDFGSMEIIQPAIGIVHDDMEIPIIIPIHRILIIITLW
jgi:hypothetical protein